MTVMSLPLITVMKETLLSLVLSNRATEEQTYGEKLLRIGVNYQFVYILKVSSQQSCLYHLYFKHIWQNTVNGLSEPLKFDIIVLWL